MRWPVFERTLKQPLLVLEKRRLQIDDFGGSTFLNSSEAPAWPVSGVLAGPMAGALKREPTRRSQTQTVASLDDEPDAM